ncbi:MAG: AMP-binding protein [Acidimicrobiales bacterium]
MSARTFREYVENLGRFGDNLALTNRDFLKVQRLTHRELRDAAQRVANLLRSLGLEPGDRVMVVAANAPAWVELLLGTLLSGAILVPVDAASSEERVARVAKETTPRVAFVNRGLRVDDASCATYFLDELESMAAHQPTRTPEVALDSSMPAVIVFTSGTTADPKGVVLSHENILTNIEGILERIHVGEDWRFLSVLPLSHMYEMSASLASLSCGASIFYVPRVTPRAITEALNDYQINTILAIPQLLAIMLERINQAVDEKGKTRAFALMSRVSSRLPFAMRRCLFFQVHAQLGGHLRLVVTGGAPIPLEVGTAWERFGVRLVQGYGLTETSPILTCNAVADRRLDSPGRPLDNVQLRVGAEGEIQAKGPSVFGGYWRNDEATRAAFTDDGWFRTGDVGVIEDGWLRIRGRLKFVIVRASGLKVFPEDVELRANADPVLAGACVVGVRGEKDESVVAVVTGRHGDDEVTAAVANVNAMLEPFQHIDAWRRWPEEDFPRTRLLKVDRRQVQDWANEIGPSRVDEPPVATGDDQITHVIRLSLDDPNASVRESDRLDDLGLDSLRRLVVVSLLEEQLGVSIPDDAVNAETTVGALRALAGAVAAVSTPQRAPGWPYWRITRLLGDVVREGVIDNLVRIWVRTDVEGAEHLEALSGPALFIFNHSDDFDGPVVYRSLPASVRRRLAVAAGDDVLRDHRWLAFVIRWCFAGFSFARSEPYLASLEYVGSMIDRGWNVLIAPEGRIDNSGQLRPFKTGIGLLAVNLGVPVVPVKTIGLTGTVPLHAKWPKKHSHVVVRIGEPVCFARHEDYEEVTHTLHQLVERL